MRIKKTTKIKIICIILLFTGYIICGSILFWGNSSGSINNITHIDDSANYDLIIVFKGCDGRIKSAFELLHQSKIPKIIVSPATNEQMVKYQNTYSHKKHIDFVLEPKARTTHENAYYCSKIIITEKAKQILLITSDYHMRRSYRLLHGALKGYGSIIHCYSVSDDRLSISNKNKILKKERVSEFLSFIKFLYDGLQIRKNYSFEIIFHEPFRKLFHSLLKLQV